MNYTEKPPRELRRMTRETPMGESFEWNCVRYRVVKDDTANCFACGFRGREACCWASCIGSERPDGKPVRFEIAEGGEK